MKPEDINDLKQLIEFLKEHQVAEFDVDRGDLKIRLKFNPPPASASSVAEFKPFPPAQFKERQRQPPPHPMKTQICTSSSHPLSEPIMARLRREQRLLSPSAIASTRVRSSALSKP
jgi:hypothetical protein